MPEPWFALSPSDLAEALDVAAAKSGRPAHLLEKDLWVVWALSAIYSSPLADALTFKGGTSLSKVYKVIDRFSEDIDLTGRTSMQLWRPAARSKKWPIGSADQPHFKLGCESSPH